jgi:hypothetical protein
LELGVSYFQTHPYASLSETSRSDFIHGLITSFSIELSIYRLSINLPQTHPYRTDWWLVSIVYPCRWFETHFCWLEVESWKPCVWACLKMGHSLQMHVEWICNLRYLTFRQNHWNTNMNIEMFIPIYCIYIVIYIYTFKCQQIQHQMHILDHVTFVTIPPSQTSTKLNVFLWGMVNRREKKLCWLACTGDYCTNIKQY